MMRPSAMAGLSNNMKGYSKMKMVAKTNSLRSLDEIMLADLDPIFPADLDSKRRSLQIISNPETVEDVKGEVFGVILSRKSPTAAAAAGHSDSHRFGQPDEQDDQIITSSSSSSSSSSLHSAVKRAFSMRRSCSVSERYCRIHDNFLPLSPPPHYQAVHGGAAAAATVRTGSSSKNKAQLVNSKLLKACKRIFRI